MPRLTRPDGTEIHWEERGEGPLVIFSPHFLNYPAVFEGLLGDLASDHRVVLWDPRGTGRSSRTGPYDVETDVGDLGALLESTGPATLLEFLAPRSIYLAHARPELAHAVVCTGTAPPLGSAEMVGAEGFAGSREVIDGLERLLESDYRAALRAILENTNRSLGEEELRARIDETAATIEHAAALGRLRLLRDVTRLAPQAAALGSRLQIVCFETLWYTPAMVARARELLPEARVEEVEDGPISRPDFTAASVRRATRSGR